MNPRFSAAGVERLRCALQGDVDRGLIPGGVIAIAAVDGSGICEPFGCRDAARRVVMTTDSIFRIYSMTKPLVSVATMMLMEAGQLLISDPVARYLPEFSKMKRAIHDCGEPDMKLVACEREMTVHDLLRHTSGLTYGVFGDSGVKSMYRAARIGRRGIDNAGFADALSRLPLAYEPGTTWEYSHATDLLGALIERVSGLALDKFLDRHILDPLGMTDTAFWVAQDKHQLIAEPLPTDPVTGASVRLLDVRSRPTFLSGGGGLVSTAGDYLRFARMLLGGGTVDGVRILSRKSVDWMSSDHLAELPAARTGGDYLPGPGYGFGLGFAVRLSQGGAIAPGSVGDFSWSGLAGSCFWVDPAEGFVVVWMMQAPEQRAHYRQRIRALVYGALE